MAKKVLEVIAILEAHGWRQMRQRGSHRQFKHPEIEGIVTVAGKRSDTMRIGTLSRIRRETGIEELR